MSEADDSGANSAVAGEMMGLQLFFSRVKRQLVWWRRRFVPMLVWYGDEVDVGVQFSREKLDPESPFRSFFTGELREVEKSLSAMGVGFDTGIGPNGRDWEWDWSLSGPISVKFRRRAKHPERRCEPPKPRLIVDNAA